MATATIGTMQELQPGAEPIMAYLERLKAFLDANGIANDNRAAVLVSTIGHKTYAVLRSLTAPATPQSKSYADLVQALKTHYQPKRLIIAERYMFNQRIQHPGESIADYVAELRRLATTCNFGDFMDDALRDRLVCGLRSENSRRRLLADADGTTTFARVTELAQSFEQADKNARAVKGAEASLQKLSVTPRRQRPDTSSQHKPCYRCGKTNHEAKDCRFSDATCNYCKKKGHIATVCRKKLSAVPRTNTKHVAAVSDESDDDYCLHSVKAKTSQPILITLQVEDTPLRMEPRHWSSIFGDF